MRLALLVVATLSLHAEHVEIYSKALRQKVGFEVELPDGYDKGIDRHPVIYRLPGAPDAARNAAAILVKPANAAQRWIVQDLIPYVDAHFRTMATRGARHVEGAEQLTSKYPRLFSKTGITALATGEQLEYKPGLLMHIVKPAQWKATNRRPAVVWIHGGGWTAGDPSGFLPHARYYAAKGAVGFSLQYRLAKPDRSIAVEDCVRDVQDAMRYLRKHARELGIDPRHIALAGDSAGGHLALASIIPADQPIELPNAIIDCNGIADLEQRKWADRARDPHAVSPIHFISAKTPPTLILHGEADTVVPVGDSRILLDTLQRYGVKAELVTWPESKHAFVNTGYQAPSMEILRALKEVDRFLKGLGFFR